ncbi:serine/threonine-protein kinase [Thermogemmatispora sp.]|uniref:serine/threonine-protein kinase n=1 Tax=Thermogemmatispora sp. TaxID=1968838 RepID=UPI001D77D819|nr:serine/threonine-protein kinase [Thermogemmatispora sp.]MBX5449190.1 serine/threonine protein kinase [Thermogemmatispora sp.]
MLHSRGQELIGKTVGGYVLEKLLGYGGTSAVYLARRSEPDASFPPVALKVFLPRTHLTQAKRAEFLRRFRQETQAASRLEHPHILPIYTWGEDDGLAYLVMPYMAGGTLAHYVRQHGPLSLEQAASYLEQIASALDYAHQRGYIHCDVKPANILLDGQGNAFLSDFGIARLLKDELPNTAGEAPAGQQQQEEMALPPTPVGTPDYLAPEQALNEPVDHRADIYALGATLFYLLAGRPPFLADSPIALALLHVHEPPPALCELDPRIPPQVDYVLRKALAKFPEERFSSAHLLSEAFRQAISGPDTPARLRLSVHGLLLPAWVPFSVVQRLEALPIPPCLSGRWKTLLLILLLLLLLCSGSLAFASSALQTAHRQSPNQTIASLPQANTGRSQPEGETTAPVDHLLAGAADWPHGPGAFFADGEYHLLNTSTHTSALALYAHHHFDNFHLAINVRQVRGSHDDADYYGVVFRASSDQQRYYVFAVASWGGGSYALWRYSGHWSTLSEGPAPSLLIGPGAVNTLEVDAHGPLLRLFINGKALSSAPLRDSMPLAPVNGSIGLYVEEEGSEIACSQLYIGPARF